MEQIERIKKIDEEIDRLAAQRQELMQQLESVVTSSGEVKAYGYRAYLKAGRAKVDHETAAKDCNASTELIEKHSKTKTTTSWAKVTYELGVNLSPYTTYGDPVFTVEKVQNNQGA